MSLCRWSSMNWSCDLYIYEGVDGNFHTHVAGNRIVGKIPEVDNSIFHPDVYTEELGKIWAMQRDAQEEFLDNCKREDITLPFAGEYFIDSRESLIERLQLLKELGYNFPDITLEDLEC